MSRLLYILAIVCVTACKQNELMRFKKVSSDHSKVKFSNNLRNKESSILQYMYYYNGGGVALGDINNDGWVDIFFTANEGSNMLFVNKGKFVFEDITKEAGVENSGDWSTGATFVDINSDGFLDIYVCQVGGYQSFKGRNQLLVNNGDMTFTDKAEEYGLDFSGLSTQSVFFDYDNDGDLDMYLLNHSVHSASNYGSSILRNRIDSISGDRLYINVSNGANIGFINAASSKGIYSSQIGYGLGVAVSDINDDGWLDIYVANDFHENDYLYINNKNGTFTESLEHVISHTSRYSMGCDIGDVNGDTRPDIITVDMLPENPEILLKSASEDSQEVYDIKAFYGYGPQYTRNCLQINKGDYFVEIGQYSGMHATDWSWSALLADFDNNASNDLFITTGIFKRPNDLDYIQYVSAINPSEIAVGSTLEKDLIAKMPTLKISNFMFQFDEDIKSNNVTEAWGLSEPSYSNGASYADLDNDGDLDIVTNNVNQEATIWENRANGNGFLKIQLRSSSSNLFGIGAKVIAYCGGKKLMRELVLTRGFQSSVPPLIHFGLGSITKIDSVEVRWRDRKKQVVKDVNIGSTITIQESSQKPPDDIRRQTNIKYITRTPLPYMHEENVQFKDYSKERLLPYFLSREGPALAVADVNGDKLDDVYFGGGRGQPGRLLLQKNDGIFDDVEIDDFLEDSVHEDVDAVFADFNNDTFADLYVVDGGNESVNSLGDRIYLNNGKGRFRITGKPLSRTTTNGSCARPADFDKDGNLDLFVGSRSNIGQFGTIPSSYILKGDGRGGFNVHQIIDMGMVTDGEWFDYDNDGQLDLVVVGDWMPITIYLNKNNTFAKSNSIKGLKDTNGWWRSVAVIDVNNDEQMDIVAGNVGENLKIKPTNIPVSLVSGDFDDNGNRESLLFYESSATTIPLYLKAQIGKQLPMVHKKFSTNTDFSKIKTPEDFLDFRNFDGFSNLVAYTFKSMLFVSKGAEGFYSMDLPNEAQYTTITDILAHDLNKDGYIDLMMTGNWDANSVALGNMRSLSRMILLGSKKGFKLIDAGLDKYSFSKVGRKIKIIDGFGKFVIANNNDSLEINSIQLDGMRN